MKTTSYKVSEALKDVWRWREALTEGVTHESVEEQLRMIARRGDEAARILGFDVSAAPVNCVAETAEPYRVGADRK